MKSHPLKRFLIAIGLFCAILLGCILYWRWFREGDDIQDTFQKEPYSIRTGASFSEGDVPILSELSREMSMVSSHASQSVVTISGVGSIELGKRVMFDGRMENGRILSKGQGSGVIVSSEGHIITNYHVIKDKSYIQAVLENGKILTTRTIGIDRLLDIAVLKVDIDEDLTPLPFGDSDKVETGQVVMALGTPYGWSKTVTQGIVSGRDRQSDSGGNYIQTDALIHQGNSGGALINIYGEMIGVTTNILSNKNSSGGAMAFALPSNIVLQAFKHICEYGRPMRGYLGIDLTESTDGIKNWINYSGEEGAVVNSVRYNSPAEKAGLMIGDVILECNDNKIVDHKALLRDLESFQSGDMIKFVVWRQGKQINVKITLDDTMKELEDDKSSILASNGISVRATTLEERSYGIHGILVEDINFQEYKDGDGPNSFHVGDLIIGVDNKRVGSVKVLEEKLKQPATVTLIRNGNWINLKVDLNNKSNSAFSKKEAIANE